MSQEKTQRERIDAILRDVHPPSIVDISKLRALLRETQNGPPDGMRDESISAELWVIVKGVIDSADKLARLLNEWEAAVEGTRPPPESA